jgi:hypothetical protein
MIATNLNSISLPPNQQGFRIDASLPFRVVWGDGDITNYPSGLAIYISHTYSTPYNGDILIQSSDLTSITRLEPKNVNPQIGQNTLKYLEIQTSQLKDLDGLLIMGGLGGVDYFLSGDIDLLPSTLTTLRSNYSNCSGNIANLPPNLQIFDVNSVSTSLNQSNTILGDVSNLPTTLTTFVLSGNNTVSGNVNNIPCPLLTIIVVLGLNLISGDISLMSTPNLLRIQIEGNNTIFGDLGGLSNSVTFIQLKGKNTVTGDISTLPPNLTYLLVWGISPGGNTLYGDISTLNYSTLDFIQILGNNNISGNISTINLKTNAFFQLDGNNTLTGDIATLGNSFAHSSIIIEGNNNIYGNIQDLPSNATRIEIHGNNTISGDLSLINLNTRALYIYGNNSISTFSDSSRIFTDLQSIIILSGVFGNGFNSTNLDKLLTSYANSTWVGASRGLNLKGTSSPKYTAAALASFNTLTTTKQVVVTLS